MTSLKTLHLIPLPNSSSNPTLDRRTRMVARLEEQKLLLKDPSYQRLVKSWAKNEAGEKTLLESKQRILPWWSVQPNGSYVFFIRSGWRAIEFEKGKAGISVPSQEKLPFVIDTLITAVRNGELDEQVAQASKQARPPKPKSRQAA